MQGAPLAEVQLEVMKAVWRTGGGSVEDIRRAMPSRYRGAYNTTQTMLNRLAERGLLSRTAGPVQRGPTSTITYRATLSEEAYLSRSIQSTLAGASREARHLAIAQLIGELDEDELRELRRSARDGQ
jgi:predicted transcriptional regulator